MQVITIDGEIPMLFRKKIDRSCAYCKFGAILEDGNVLCAKKGLKTLDDQCRRFKYDPIKRIPVKAKALDFSKYEDADFSL